MCKTQLFTLSLKKFQVFSITLQLSSWENCLSPNDKNNKIYVCFNYYKELWCWRRLLRVPWKARRSNQSNENQPWLFTGRTDDEGEAPILWPPDVKSPLIGKDPDARKDWGQEKGETEDEMVGWHHRLKGHGFEQTPGDSEGQGSLVCCSLWGHRESNTT